MQVFQLKYTTMIQDYLDHINNTVKLDIHREICNVLKKISQDYDINYNELFDKYACKRKIKKKSPKRKNEFVNAEFVNAILYNKYEKEGKIYYIPESGNGQVFDNNNIVVGTIENGEINNLKDI